MRKKAFIGSELIFSDTVHQFLQVLTLSHNCLIHFSSCIIVMHHASCIDDTLYNTLIDTLHNTLFDTLHHTFYDTLYNTLYNTLYDALHKILYNTLYDTLHDTFHDTLTRHIT